MKVRGWAPLGCRAGGRPGRAEGNVPVEQDGQVPTPRENGDLVRGELGEVGLTAEVDEEPGQDQVTDRSRPHPRPAARQRHAERLRQSVRAHRARQRGTHRLWVGGRHHRTRPPARPDDRDAPKSTIGAQLGWCRAPVTSPPESSWTARPTPNIT